MVGNHWWYHNLIWFVISSIVLALGSGTNSHSQRHSHTDSSLVNASLDVESKGQNLNSVEGHEKEDDNMVAMVASLSATNYGTFGVAENEFEEPQMAGKRGETEEKGAKALNCEWHLKLDLSNRYRLDWTVDYPGNEIIFALNINHTSSSFHRGSDIFALGFSENGQLSSSDFCIIWYDLSHKLHLQDARTDSNNRLQLIDADQSYCRLVKFGNKHSRWSGRSVEDGRIVHEDDGGGSSGDEAASNLPEVQRIVFKRPLDVCSSSRPYYKIDNGTTHLVWFTIKGPLLSIDGLDLTQLEKSLPLGQHHHQHLDGSGNGADSNQFEWAMRRVQLIRSNDFKQQQQQSAKSLSLDIRMDKFEIPAKETTYWCKLFRLPHKFETRRYHLTQYEATIEKGNEHVVHHMELFNCANLNTEQEQGLHDLYANGNVKGGWSGDCSGRDRPKATEPCRKVILAWAMGARPLIYPDQVGQSIGGLGYSPYVVLEVHYNNVESSPGLIDNSGLRFHYTSKLRPYDAGILEVGLEYTDKVSIPPGIVTPIAGHCVGECTRLAMSLPISGDRSLAGSRKLSSPLPLWLEENGQEEPITSRNKPRSTKQGANLLEDGIYIFAGQMHTHLAGVASWTEIVREGKLVTELQRDDHYSPHFQEIRLLPSHVHVAPGDSLVHYCLYDTKQRANITLGGYATSDEMCVTYLHYYPRIDLEVCKSSVDTSALEAYFAYLASEEKQNTSDRLVESQQAEKEQESVQPKNIDAKTVSENYHSIQWNPRRSKELIQFYAQAPLSVQCNRSDGNRWPGYWNGVTPTRLWSNLKAEVQPFETRLPKGDQLIAYRGRGFGHRHAQCKANVT